MWKFETDADLAEILLKRFHSTEKIKVIQINQPALQSQMSVARLEVEPAHILDEAIESAHCRELSFREVEVVQVYDLVGPARYEPIPRVADERKFKMVLIQFGRVVEKAGTRDIERNRVFFKVIQNRAGPHLGNSKPDELSLVRDREVIRP